LGVSDPRVLLWCCIYVMKGIGDVRELRIQWEGKEKSKVLLFCWVCLVGPPSVVGCWLFLSPFLFQHWNLISIFMILHYSLLFALGTSDLFVRIIGRGRQQIISVSDGSRIRISNSIHSRFLLIFFISIRMGKPNPSHIYSKADFWCNCEENMKSFSSIFGNSGLWRSFRVFLLKWFWDSLWLASLTIFWLEIDDGCKWEIFGPLFTGFLLEIDKYLDLVYWILTRNW